MKFIRSEAVSRVDRFHSLEAKFISIERVNCQSMPTYRWHRSRSFDFPFDFGRNSVMSLNRDTVEDARKRKNLGLEAELKCVACPIQITFHWHASPLVYAARLLSTFRLLSTRERKAIFLFLSFLPPFPSFFSNYLIAVLLLLFTLIPRSLFLSLENGCFVIPCHGSSTCGEVLIGQVVAIGFVLGIYSGILLREAFVIAGRKYFLDRDRQSSSGNDS